MSRSRPRVTIENPVKFNVGFNGKTGVWSAYEVSTKQSHELKSFNMVYLDNRASATGWNEKLKMNIFGTPVKRATDNMKVYGKTGSAVVIAEGPWKEIKEAVEAKNGKFCTLVYGLLWFNKDWHLARLEAAGAVLGAWIDFKKGVNPEGDLVIHASKTGEGKQGSVDYIYPIFAATEARNPDVFELAAKVDEEVLQPYFDKLDDYMAGKSQDEASRQEAEPVTKETAANQEVAPRSSSDQAKEDARRNFFPGEGENVKVEDDDDDLPF